MEAVTNRARRLQSPFRELERVVPGFTLVEMLVGLAILSLLLVLMLGVVNQTSSAVRNTSAKVDAFQQARTAFDIMTRTLSQATLNTYWDYYDASGNRRTVANAGAFEPKTYGRASDLDFVVSTNGHLGQSIYFTSPLAYSANSQKAQTEGLLNACGYFVEFADASTYQPSIVGTGARLRYLLMQSMQPTENFAVFRGTNSSWTADVQAVKWPIASNVIAFIVQPRLSPQEDAAGTKLSADYTYDARSGTDDQRAQLPPVVQLTMVVIDKVSADRLASGNAEPVAISTALTGKFTDPAQYSADLKALETALTAAKINYQVFTSAVPLRESKWSAKQ